MNKIVDELKKTGQAILILIVGMGLVAIISLITYGMEILFGDIAVVVISFIVVIILIRSAILL